MSVLSVCICVPAEFVRACPFVSAAARAHACVRVCAIQMGLSEGFAHANEAT